MALPAPGTTPMVFRMPPPGCWARMIIPGGLLAIALCASLPFLPSQLAPTEAWSVAFLGMTVALLGTVVLHRQLRGAEREQWDIAMDAEGIWPAELDRRRGLIPWKSIDAVCYDRNNTMLILFGPGRQTLMLVAGNLANFLEARINIALATKLKIVDVEGDRLTPLEAVPVHRRTPLPLGLRRRPEGGTDTPRFGSE